MNSPRPPLDRSRRRESALLRVLKEMRGLMPAATSVVAGLFVGFPAGSTTQAANDPRGSEFFAWQDFSTFAVSHGEQPGTTTLTSPEFVSGIPARELIASWNAEMPPGSLIEIAACARYADDATKFYVLGRWSSDPDTEPRESVRGQADDDGDVLTDTLTFKRSSHRFQLRFTLTPAPDGSLPRLKLAAVCLTDPDWTAPDLPPNRQAWGKVIDVPKRSQLAYEGGDEWCSPASTAMVLGFWAARLGRPELLRDVPEVARWVHDPAWPGTGNWAFNTAFAGSHAGFIAYVTRLSDVAELEDWIAAGLPVVLSLDYSALQGKADEPSGHLVVCVGFTEQGDVIVNDPGTRHEVRRTFPRENLIKAWAHSRRTVYVIHPESAAVPKDRFGHWLAIGSRVNANVSAPQ